MAEPLKFRVVPGAVHQTAREELEGLLQILHESGTLRVIAGVCGRFPEILGVLLDRLGTEEGLDALSNVAIAGAQLFEIHASSVARVASGVREGLAAAAEHAPRKPYTRWHLLAQLNHPDTRRGAFAALSVLQAVGRQLRIAEENARRER